MHLFPQELVLILESMNRSDHFVMKRYDLNRLLAIDTLHNCYLALIFSYYNNKASMVIQGYEQQAGADQAGYSSSSTPAVFQSSWGVEMQFGRGRGGRGGGPEDSAGRGRGGGNGGRKVCIDILRRF